MGLIEIVSPTWRARRAPSENPTPPGDAPKPSLLIYLGMGWLGALVLGPLVERLDGIAVAWVLTGALLYSAGTVFYANPRGWRHAHGTWHLFVIGGTLCHYVAVTQFVL